MGRLMLRLERGGFLPGDGGPRRLPIPHPAPLFSFLKSRSKKSVSRRPIIRSVLFHFSPLRRFSKISWSRRASRSSSARFFSANSRIILS